MKTKNTFVFNLEWAEALDGYGPEVEYAFYHAVVHYARTGEVLHIADPVARIAFRFIRLELDRAQKRKTPVAPKPQEPEQEPAQGPVQSPEQVAGTVGTPPAEVASTANHTPTPIHPPSCTERRSGTKPASVAQRINPGATVRRTHAEPEHSGTISICYPHRPRDETGHSARSAGYGRTCFQKRKRPGRDASACQSNYLRITSRSAWQ